jgi:pimeloyl-[acyl-carrier protein] synthase
MSTINAAAAEVLDFPFQTMPEIGNAFLTRLDTIRETDPVFWSDAQHGWLITRHADLLDAFRCKFPLSNRRISETAFVSIPADQRAERIPLLYRFTPMILNNTDGPFHGRVRRLVMKAFGKSAVESIRPRVAEHVEAILNDMADGRTVEFVSEIARPITGMTILRLLGIPEKNLQNFKGWSDQIANSLGGVAPTVEQVMAGEQAMTEIHAVFSEVIAARRKEPKEDVFTELVRASDEGDTLTEDEIISTGIVLLIAGHDTTLNSMVLAVEALSKQSDLREWIRSNPEATEAAVIELSRTTAMSAFETRLAASDFEWHGKQIKAGQFIYLMIAAGNRDPRAYDNPLEADFSRKNHEVLTWGPGLHHCIGHMLAKMQLSEFIGRAYRRFDQIEVIEPYPTFLPAPSFRGFGEMFVKARS